MYALYVRDPDAVPEAWRTLFAEMDPNGAAARPSGVSRPGPVATAPTALAETTAGAAGPATAVRPSPASAAEAAIAARQDRVDQLVRASRVIGHLAAKINPLGFDRPVPPELDPAYYGFQSDDMSLVVSSDTIPGADVTTLGELIERLRTTYCRSIGVEYMHIQDT